MISTNKAAPERPAVTMLDLIVSYWVSCGVHVAAKLGLADQLSSGPRTVEELARAAGSHAPSLYRLLRMLASSGVFRERADGRFENTPLSETLRSDVVDSMRGFAVMMVDGYNLVAWSDLLVSVRTGTPAFRRVHGQEIFGYLAAHPEKAREFGESMTSLSRTENPAIVGAYDFSGTRTLVDVGGGHGSLVTEILRKTPGLRGVVYDRPEVIEAAKREVHLREPGVAERCELVAGDFFESVPEGDAHLLKYIVHDWDDERCVRILSNCCRASRGKGRVLVVDTVVPPGNDPHWSKLLDVNMLVVTGGRERSRDEFAQLLARAGLRLQRIVPTACPLSIVEAIAA
jgi:hypothetical protein